MVSENDILTIEQKFGIEQLKLLANCMNREELIELLICERKSVYILHTALNFIEENI